MTGSSLSRRPLLAGLAAFALAAGLAMPAAAQGVSAVRVDVTPRVAAGWGPNADAVRRVMTEELRNQLGAGGRGGARLLVTVEGISLSSYAGGGGGRFSDGGGETDYLESTAILVGPRGEVLGRFPVLSAIPASSGGAWYLPDNEPRRLVALAKHNAAWIKTKVAGR